MFGQPDDLDALFRKGDNRQNYVLRGGDALHVAERDGAEKVFVMGEVKKPGTIRLTRFDVSLSEALSNAGGINEETANPQGIFVVRKEKATDKLPTVYQLPLQGVHSMLLAEQFTLRKRDIVYVTAAPVSRWNRVISQITSTLNNYSTIDSLSQ